MPKINIDPATKAARKRAQNRESQRKYRERYISRINELEREVEALKTTQGSMIQGDDHKQTVIRLVKENKELKDCILSLRDKLSSMMKMVKNEIELTDDVLSRQGLLLKGQQQQMKEIEVQELEIYKEDIKISGAEFNGGIYNGDNDRIHSICELNGIENEVGSPDESTLAGLYNLTRPVPSVSLNWSVPPDELVTYPEYHQKFVKLDGRMRSLLRQIDFSKSSANLVVERSVRCISEIYSNPVPGLRAFIISLGGYRWFVTLWQWYLWPTEENYLKIPQGFRPTPMQLISAGQYNPLLNFAAWPELRDRLIYEGNNYSVYEVLADVNREAVIDTPKGAVYICDYESVVLGEPSSPSVTLQEVIESGIDNNRRWKLSAKFAKKYPRLVTPEIVSKLPTVQIKKLSGLI